MGKLGETLGQIGSAAGGVGSLVGSVASLFGNNKVDYDKQLDYQKKLNEAAALTNYTYNERAAVNAAKREAEYYEKYDSPSARVSQLKEAGLNTALMYSGAGGGGSGANIDSSSGGASGAASSQNNSAQLEAVQVQKQQMRLQMAEMASVIDLNKATAEEKRANASYTSGAQTDETTANVESITQDVKNKQVQRTGMILQNDFDRIRNRIQEATEIDQIHKLKYDAEKIHYEIENLVESLHKAVRENDIGDATKDDAIKQIQTQTRQAAADLLETAITTQAKKQGMDVEFIKLNLDRLRYNIENKEHQLHIIDRQVDLHKYGASMDLAWSEHEWEVVKDVFNILVGAGTAVAIGKNASARKSIKGQTTTESTHRGVTTKKTTYDY